MNRKFVYYLIKLILWNIIALSIIPRLFKNLGFNTYTLLWLLGFGYAIYQIYDSEQKIKSTF